MLRRYFGRVLFPSSFTQINLKKRFVSVQGEGLGHGVGMCQIGALYMAKKGKNYREILAHYFPKFRLEKVY
jgi:stage II sporulation protein D